MFLTANNLRIPCFLIDVYREQCYKCSILKSLSFIMLRSMTAFGRAIHSFQHGRIVVEIQSVNKKYLEVQANLPTELLRFETDLKKWISERLTRGSVNVRVSAKLDDSAGVGLEPNMLLVRQLKSAWTAIYQELRIDSSEPIDPELFVNQPNLLIISEELKDEQGCRKALYTAVEEALEQHIQMREREGQAIANDFMTRIAEIASLVAIIAERAPQSVKNYENKLRERILEVAAGLADNDERILREICVYADRVDVAEEVTRLKAHLDHFSDVMGSNQISQGKTLEFILQEMGREINTIGSKCADVEISRNVVVVKGELERIREQVQNVE